MWLFKFCLHHRPLLVRNHQLGVLIYSEAEIYFHQLLIYSEADEKLDYFGDQPAWSGKICLAGENVESSRCCLCDPSAGAAGGQRLSFPTLEGGEFIAQPNPNPPHLGNMCLLSPRSSHVQYKHTGRPSDRLWSPCRKSHLNRYLSFASPPASPSPHVCVLLLIFTCVFISSASLFPGHCISVFSRNKKNKQKKNL